MRLAHQSYQRNPGENLHSRAPAPDALDLLEQFGSTVTVQRGCEIYRQDDLTEFCWRIIFGCARMVRLLEDGRRQVGDFHWVGDFLGLDDLDRHDFSAEAVTHVTLRRNPRRMVESLAQSHLALVLRLRTLSMTNLERTRQQTILLGRKTAMERVATFLLDIHRHSKAPESQVVDIPMSRTDVADYLGMTVETVCRVLAQLRRESIVRVKENGVELLDQFALLRFASVP